MLNLGFSSDDSQLSISQKLLLTAGFYLLFCLWYLPQLDLIPLINEETRRAIVAIELLNNGNFLIPTIGGELYTAKPPLFNWLIMLASGMDAGQVNEFNARIVSVISLAILVATICYLTRNWWSTKSLLLLAVLLALSPAMVRKATLAEIDITFTLLVNLAIFSWFCNYQCQRYKQAWLISAVFIGLAYLCKREAALLFYVLSIASWLIYQKQVKTPFISGIYLAIAIILLSIATWIGPIIAEYGVYAFVKQTSEQVALRQHEGSFVNYLFSSISYPFEVLVSLLPATLPLALLLIKKFRQQLSQYYGERFSFLALISLVNLVPYILLGDSNVRYYLPMFPAIFILATMAVSQIDLFYVNEKNDHRHIQLAIKIIVYYLPIVFLSLSTVAIIYLVVTATLSGSLTYLLILAALATLLYLIRLCYARIQAKVKLSRLVLEYLLVIILAVRLIDFGYTTPRKYQNTLAERDITAMLQDIANVANQQQASIIALPQFSHAFLYFDKDQLIMPKKCGDKISANDLHLSIQTKDDFQTLQLASENKIVWYSNYRNNYVAILTTAEQHQERFVPNKSCLIGSN
ncbi:ArnT family glycosyltransferase [Colwellia sp. MEBiC06753]